MSEPEKSAICSYVGLSVAEGNSMNIGTNTISVRVNIKELR